jgi:hypothetical protein
MKKILLVYDEEGWIFFRHCEEIKKRLSDEYAFEMVNRKKNIAELSRQYDLVYILDPMPLKYPDPTKTILGLRNEFMHLEHPEG